MTLDSKQARTYFAAPNGLGLGTLEANFGEDNGEGLVEPVEVVEVRGSNSSFLRPI